MKKCRFVHVVPFEFPGLAAFYGEIMNAVRSGARTPICLRSMVPNHSGVYLIYLCGRLVYVGKTYGASGRTLRTRLGNHYAKLSGRKGIDLADVSVMAIPIADPHFILAVESYLIESLAPEWNRLKGFGKNFQGYGRDHPASEWELLYPELRKRRAAGA
jgi:hypothetical protein